MPQLSEPARAVVMLAALGVSVAGIANAQVTGAPQPGAAPAAVLQSVRDTSPAARLVELERLIADRDQQSKAEINRLSSELQRLSASASARRGATSGAEERLVKLEQLNYARYNAAVDAQALRYETGKEIYVSILGDVSKLKVAVGLANSLTRFAVLANPAEVPAFRQTITQLTQGDQAVDKANFASVPAFLSNPYVSAAISVASLFTSKLNRPAKETTLGKLLCVIDITSRVQGDLGIVRNRSAELLSRLTSFQRTVQGDFEGYGKVVGYTGTWQNYQSARKQGGKDPFSASIDTVFRRIRSDSATRAPTGQGPELGGTHFALERAKQHLTTYDALVQESEDFLTGYRGMLDRARGQTCAPMQEQLNQVPAMVAEVDTLLEEFSSFKQTISGKNRGDLFAVVF
jgi:hypothetical protein